MDGAKDLETRQEVEAVKGVSGGSSVRRCPSSVEGSFWLWFLFSLFFQVVTGWFLDFSSGVSLTSLLMLGVYGGGSPTGGSWLMPTMVDGRCCFSCCWCCWCCCWCLIFDRAFEKLVFENCNTLEFMSCEWQFCSLIHQCNIPWLQRTWERWFCDCDCWLNLFQML